MTKMAAPGHVDQWEPSRQLCDLIMDQSDPSRQLCDLIIYLSSSSPYITTYDDDCTYNMWIVWYMFMCPNILCDYAH